MERRYIAHGLLVTDGRVLLLHRLAGRYLGGQWDIPGGTVEHDETPAEACVREVHEETGLRVRLGPEIARITNLDTGGRDIEFVTVTYLVVPPPGTDVATIATRPEEHDAFEWVTVAEARARRDVVCTSLQHWTRGSD